MKLRQLPESAATPQTHNAAATCDSRFDTAEKLSRLRNEIDRLGGGRPDWAARFCAARDLVALLLSGSASDLAAQMPETARDREACPGFAEEGEPSAPKFDDGVRPFHPHHGRRGRPKELISKAASALQACAGDEVLVKAAVLEFVSEARERSFRGDEIMGLFGLGKDCVLAVARLPAEQELLAISALDSVDVFD